MALYLMNIYIEKTEERQSMKQLFNGKELTLILASNSPRRKELLEQYKIPFQVLTAETCEINMEADGEGTAKYNACAKAEKVFSLLQEREGENIEKYLVLGADTVIEAESKVLGKPSNIPDAEKMLLSLAGKTHKVITGTALIAAHRKVVFAETSLVTFKSLTLAEVRAYMEKVYVLDKAGAYAAQEHGEMIIKEIRGSMENVIGLPVQEVLEELYGRW